MGFHWIALFRKNREKDRGGRETEDYWRGVSAEKRLKKHCFFFFLLHTRSRSFAHPHHPRASFPNTPALSDYSVRVLNRILIELVNGNTLLGVRFATSANLVQHRSGTEFNGSQVRQLIRGITTDTLVTETKVCNHVRSVDMYAIYTAQPQTPRVYA